MNAGRAKFGVRTVAGAAAVAALVWLTACSGTPRVDVPSAGVREPAVAGQFYPREPAQLRAALRTYLELARPARHAHPLALVLPHAGYAFSGQIAADGWAQAAGDSVDVVIVLGTHHTVGDFGGVALDPAAGLRTPLGVVPCDTALVRALAAADPVFRADAEPDAREHSIEVQLPFVQSVFPHASVVAAVVGTEEPARCARAAAVLARVLGTRRVLLVASSDLSHYPPYAAALASDRAVLAAIASLDPARFQRTIADEMAAGLRGLETCACGEGAIAVVLGAARARGARHGVIVSAANSGETSAGDRARVVGYGAVMLVPGAGAPDTSALAPPPPAPAGASLDDASETQLLAFARRTLAAYAEGGALPLARDLPPAAWRLQGAFVTLKEHGELRGCIGHMAEDLPLGQTIGAMTLAAATEDPRFAAVEARELPAIAIEISALTPLERLAHATDVVIGRDGIEIRKDGHAGVFLPEVPVEQHWDFNALMVSLCRKAGLPDDAWRSGAEFYTFRSIHFAERR